MKLKRFLLSAALVALASQAFAQAGGPYSAPSVRTYMGPSLGELYQPSAGINAGVNAQTGTSYTVLNSDQGKLTTFSNTGAVAVTLPQAGTGGFEANKVFYFTNKNTGAVTITPTTSTIGGAATLVLNQNRSAQVVSDGTNYLLQTSSSSATVSPVSEGGTGAATFTAHGVLTGEGTSAFAATAAGASGIPLIGQGAADPIFGTAIVAGGGTGAATFTAHGPLLGEGTSALVPMAAGTTGQLIQGVTGADPAWATALSGAYNFTNALVTYGNSAGVPTHIATQQQTAPALTSCGGGSPAISGTDEAGIVTMGTSATGCVITFNVAYTGTPFCVVNWIATPLASQSYVTSNAAITLTQTSTSSNKAQYICRAPSGG